MEGFLHRKLKLLQSNMHFRESVLLFRMEYCYIVQTRKSELGQDRRHGEEGS